VTEQSDVGIIATQQEINLNKIIIAPLWCYIWRLAP